jgi:tetratricopeptide (TPR) repeat protein
MMNCPYCGKLTDPRLDNCVHCGGFLRKKAAPGQRRSSGEKETCPTCGALVQAGDIICVACGTNLLTGQRITEEQPAPAKAEKRGFTMPRISLKWVAIGTLAFLVVVILLFLLVLVLNQDPVAQAVDAYNQGNVGEALAILDDYISSVPDSADAHQALGWIYLENQEYSRAAEELNSVVRLDPRRKDAHLGLALSWAETGGDNGRRKAIAALQDMLEQFPNEQGARFLLGLLQGMEGNPEGLVDTLREVALGEGAVALEAQRLTAVGDALQGYTQAARNTMGEVLNQAPNNGDALAAAGILAAEENDYIAATEYLRAAVESGTSFDAEALTHLGILLISQGEFADAREQLKRAMTLDPANDRARFFHAVCQRERGLYEEAIRELDPLMKGSGPLAGQAAVETARAYLAMDDAVRAAENAERAIEMGGSDAALYTVLGRAYARSGEDTAAGDAFRKALSADSEYAPAYLEFGLYHLKRDNTREAVRRFKQYLELIDPDFEGARVEEVRTLVAQLEESLAAAQGAT